MTSAASSGSGSASGSASGADPDSTAGPRTSGLGPALAAEEQAAFGFALLGPSLGAGRQDAARAAQALHADLQDRVSDLIAAAGGPVGAPLGDYPALYPKLGRPALLAAYLEDDCATGWRYAYAVAAAMDPGDTAIRRLAQQQLTAAAVRAVRWRVLAGAAVPVTAFPGL